jgi:hypothetical protein
MTLDNLIKKLASDLPPSAITPYRALLEELIDQLIATSPSLNKPMVIICTLKLWILFWGIAVP